MRGNGHPSYQLTVVRRPVLAPACSKPGPLVGREDELRFLLHAWQLAAAGQGRVVLLSGEAGIGKSRLVHELREDLDGHRHAALSYAFAPEHQGIPLHPVIRQLKQTAGVTPEEASEERLIKLEALLARGMDCPDKATAVAAALLSMDAPERQPKLTPQRRRQWVFDVLLEQVEALARREPLLMIAEDLQWADPSTLVLLDMMVNRIQRLPVLAIMTFRPEFAVPWHHHPCATQLSLGSLGWGCCELLIRHLAGGEPLAEPVVEQILARSDGIPLLVEEITRAALETGAVVNEVDDVDLAEAMPRVAISPALHPALHRALNARLDRSPEVGQIARAGAVVGYEFSCELLAAVTGMAEDRVRQVLEQLVASALLLQHGAPPHVVYRFRHALIREVAYWSLSDRARQGLHRTIGRILEERTPDLVASEPEFLALHLTSAGLLEQAIACWLRAGKRSADGFANLEAISHLSRGLELLDTLPDAPEQEVQRVDLLASLAGVLAITRSHAAPEVKQTYGLARMLCQKAGEAPQRSASMHLLFPAARSLWDYYHAQGDCATARELAAQCQELTAGMQDPGASIEAQFCVGTSALFVGELTEARERLRRSAARPVVQRRRCPELLYGRDPRSSALVHLAQALWLGGYPDQAARAADEAVETARAAGHPFGLAYASLGASWVSQFRREADAACALAAEAITCSIDEGFSALLAMASILRAWASAPQDSKGSGRAEQMRHALDDYQAMGGAGVARPYLLALIAEVDGAAGRTEKALAALAEGALASRTTGECWYEAELHRQEGELLLRQSIANRRAASACFYQAIAVAHRQGGRSLELRAATSLARVWRDQSKRLEARDLLAPVYAWFTEGFETADLADAKALLNELA